MGGRMHIIAVRVNDSETVCNDKMGEWGLCVH